MVQKKKKAAKQTQKQVDVVTFRLPPGLADDLKLIAERDMRSRNATIVRILQDAVAASGLKPPLLD